MIDPISISPNQLVRANLTIVGKNLRLRDQIDRKRAYFIAKRVFDICFSLLFILSILSWLLPMMAILIKLSSRGPVFFLQKRIGRGGRSFTCYKLRTMVINAEADIQQALENDSRVTTFGCFLRKSNIDEFPQFFNVLIGDMSIVGPRPHMYSDCAKFASILPGYKFRNMVRPGITGLAQVKGYHGPAATRNSVLMRYHWDNYYIRNTGMLLDLKIIYKTTLQRLIAVIVFFPEKILAEKPQFDDSLV
jgi:putative colanic acid biosynthesis UDP-glucose lipid carrier transferase